MSTLEEDEAWLQEPYVEQLSAADGKAAGEDGATTNGNGGPPPELWRCLLCNNKSSNTMGMNLRTLGRHCAGAPHNRKLKALVEDPYLRKEVDLSSSTDDPRCDNRGYGGGEEKWRCLLCETTPLNQEQLNQHCAETGHLTQLRLLLEAHFGVASPEQEETLDTLQWLDEPYIEGNVDERTQKEQWTCLLCDAEDMSFVELGKHCKGATHKGKLMALEDSYLEITRDYWRCLVCKEKVGGDGLTEHCKSSRHRKRFRKKLQEHFATTRCDSNNNFDGRSNFEGKDPPPSSSRDAVPAFAAGGGKTEVLGHNLESCRSLQERIKRLEDPQQRWHVNHLLIQGLLNQQQNEISHGAYEDAMDLLEEFEERASSSPPSFARRFLDRLHATCSGGAMCSKPGDDENDPSSVAAAGGSLNEQDVSIVDVVVLSSSPSPSRISNGARIGRGGNSEEEERDGPPTRGRDVDNDNIYPKASDLSDYPIDKPITRRKKSSRKNRRQSWDDGESSVEEREDRDDFDDDAGAAKTASTRPHMELLHIVEQEEEVWNTAFCM